MTKWKCSILHSLADESSKDPTQTVGEATNKTYQNDMILINMIHSILLWQKLEHSSQEEH